MIDITKDVQSLTTFRRRSGEFMKQLKKSKQAVVLTVNGKAAVVVQDAEAHEGIRQGLEQAANGRGRPAEEVFERLRRRFGIPR